MTQIATSIYTYNSETGQVEFDLKLTTAQDQPEEESKFLEKATTAIIGAMDDFFQKAVAKSGGNLVAQNLLSKPIFAVGFTADYLFKLKEEQNTHGDQGLTSKLVAAGQAAGELAVSLMLCNGSNLI